MSHFLLLLTTPDFSGFIKRFGYFGIFIWFISFDQITPLPEEISLLVIGYLVSNHVFEPLLAGIASIAGFLTIDIIYYFLSKSGSKLIKKKSKKSESPFIKSYKDKLKNNLPKTLLILCFIPRMRLWGPILIGAMKLPFKKFLLFDTLGLTLFTALYLTLGIAFHKSLSSVLDKTKSLQNIIFFGAIAVFTIITIILLRKGKKVKSKK